MTMVLSHVYLLLSERALHSIRSMSSKLSRVGISLPLKERSTCPLMPRLSTRRILPSISFSGPLMMRILSPSRYAWERLSSPSYRKSQARKLLVRTPQPPIAFRGQRSDHVLLGKNQHRFDIGRSLKKT